MSAAIWFFHSTSEEKLLAGASRATANSAPGDTRADTTAKMPSNRDVSISNPSQERMKVTDDSVLIVAEKSAGDGLLMAKKWPAPLSANVLAAALRDFARATSTRGQSFRSTEPHRNRPHGLWLLTRQRPSSRARGSDRHASVEADRGSDRTIGRSPNSPESARNSTNTSTGPKTATSAPRWRQ